MSVPRGPVRQVARATKGWDGRCPDCKRGADGFGDWIWCDCLPTRRRAEVEPWIEVGHLVQRMDTIGTVHFSDPTGPDKGEPSFGAGARGVVVEVYPPESPHRCPDHEDNPDCICCNEDGMIPGRTSAAAVAWTISDGTTIRRLIWPKDEGKRWVRLCSICEQTKDDRPWTRNGGRPAHKECALGQSVKALEDAGLRPKSRTTKAKRTKKAKGSS